MGSWSHGISACTACRVIGACWLSGQIALCCLCLKTPPYLHGLALLHATIQDTAPPWRQEGQKPT